MITHDLDKTAKFQMITQTIMKDRALGLAALTLAMGVLGACASSSSASTAQSAGGANAVPKAAAASQGKDSTNNTDQYLNIQPVVAPSSLGGKGSRLEVFHDGKSTPLRNGGMVTLDDLNVEVFVDPYPPTTLTSWLDLYMTRNGHAVSGASVTMDYQMAYMSHGVLNAAGKDSGDGHYLFSLDYAMYAQWGDVLTIQLSGKKYVLPILVTVYP